MNTITALRGGDGFIFQQVFIEYHKKLYFYILHKTRSSYLAEEVVQISFMKLWRFRETLNEDMPFSRQLFRIAKTTLIDILRKEETDRRMMAEVSRSLLSTAHPEAGALLAESELKNRIFREVMQMPPMRRKIFKMSRFNGMSYKEIAVELSLSVKTVENHISRAIKQLQDILSLLLVLFFFR